jgi:hypothetical protein
MSCMYTGNGSTTNPDQEKDQIFIIIIFKNLKTHSTDPVYFLLFTVYMFMCTRILLLLHYMTCRSCVPVYHTGESNKVYKLYKM